MRVTHGTYGRDAVARGRPHAVTIGNFDGVHLGHPAMLARLREAAGERGIPSCVLTFEPHPREFFAPDKAPTRLTSLRETLERLAAAGVDRVHVCRFDYDFARMTPEAFIERVLGRQLGARWIIVGDDFRYGARRAGDFALLKAAAAHGDYVVEAMPTVNVDGGRVSSTAVREALAAGELAKAARLLGRPYSISGRVVAGQKLGRALGFPTANVQMKHNRPALMGIFAVELQGVADAALPAVASLGVRPTVAREPVPVLEVHVLDAAGDWYGRHVRVDFLEKFRDEEKYADVETLTRQIAADVENAKNYFRRQGAKNAKERQVNR